jgi:hypothetical protein
MSIIRPKEAAKPYGGNDCSAAGNEHIKRADRQNKRQRKIECAESIRIDAFCRQKYRR